MPVHSYGDPARSRYQPLFPIFLTDWDPAGLSVGVVFATMIGSKSAAAFPEKEAERRYALRMVKQRLHQVQFREPVIDAYAGCCAISGLPEPRLLDAAHIAPDADEEFGQPVIVNGLSLSKIPHAAYDANRLARRKRRAYRF